MIDDKELMTYQMVKLYANQQMRYMRGQRSVWGFGENRMAEYLLSPFRRLKP